jgi:hypothetical protein
MPISAYLRQGESSTFRLLRLFRRRVERICQDCARDPGLKLVVIITASVDLINLNPSEVAAVSLLILWV